MNVKADFPQLSRQINGKPIVYLDSTATSLKPQLVIDKINEYYTQYTANVFRGIYTTSEEATSEYEKAREKIATLIHATLHEIVFTRSTTESLNLLAYSLHPKEVVASILEHHSNFVPWQQLAHLTVWDPEKSIDSVVTNKTDIFAITAVSNVTGAIMPVKDIVRTVKRINPKCLVVVDAAQAVPHMPVDVVDWGADFIAFSGHKMLGPTGVGVLWGRRELLEEMKPFNYGGEMISEVHVDRTVFKEPPHKFEAGTPHIAGVIGLGAAVDYLTKLGMDNVRKHEEELVSYATKKFKEVRGLRFVGPDIRSGVFAFTMEKVHPHDIAQLLNEDNVFVRAGNHCAMPLHEHLGIVATARASFYVYTTKEDIDTLIRGLQKIQKLFS